MPHTAARELARQLYFSQPHHQAACAALATSLRATAQTNRRTLPQELAALDDHTLTARYTGYLYAWLTGHRGQAMEAAAQDATSHVLAACADLPELDPLACANFRKAFDMWLSTGPDTDA
ncbi:hypothetical protein [Kitasatospora azatica]|uniref:hypothetical protein n=1 Tax=Kitasatospora azatica TaxID=58347 RepID=UPI00056CF499|nr:hypothetical protein [Kitasatospora azatica]